MRSTSSIGAVASVLALALPAGALPDAHIVGEDIPPDIVCIDERGIHILSDCSDTVCPGGGRSLIERCLGDVLPTQLSVSAVRDRVRLLP